MRINISTKLITLTILLLLSAALPIAMESSQLFEEISRKREEEANMSQAISYSLIVNQILDSKINSVKSTGNLLYTNFINNQTQSQDFDISFNKEKTLVALDLYKIVDGKPQSMARKIKSTFIDSQKLPANFFDKLRQKQNFPIRSVIAGNVEIKNSSEANSPPLLTVGVPFVDRDGSIAFIALADFEISVLQSVFSERSERTFYLVDKAGTVLAHPDEQLIIDKKNMKDYPPILSALKSDVPKKQIRFFDTQTRNWFQGAFAKTKHDVIVVSQSSEDIILEPAREVKRQAFYITGIVLSLAIFFIFLFSITLTTPIERLADLIKLVSKGHFDIQAKKVVNSHDEVGDLAIAFDHMTQGLKERDKMKNLFNKFHGSSITEDLLKKDVGLGGSNKEVTVFFSDVRGFTAFSEKSTPEEVVSMLNEYFTEMVAIINKYNGVVDKFIGDAIMAVWGAPKSTPRDAHNAVRACIEMRQALNKLNEKRIARGHSPLMIGMGLHSGRAISGTIGSSERMEYTVIGDTVNMASRIEASTKAFGVDLLISETTAQLLKDQFLIAHAGNAEVKGKSQALKLFKVNGYINEVGKQFEVKTPYSEYTAEKVDKVKIAS